MRHFIIALWMSLWCATGVGADTRALQALNDFRVAEGLAPVRYSDALEKAAARHARDMSTRQFFSHQGSDGSDIAKRVTRTGYRWCWVAENIAQGHRSLREVMYGWEISPGHRANMLSDRATEFALARTEDDVWVMVLARPQC